MGETTLIGILVALIGALGIKEIWGIWKRKIDIQSKKDMISLNYDYQILHDVIEEERKTVEEMTMRIRLLENKIDQLIEENKECAIKLARLEEKILSSGKLKIAKKRRSKKDAI